MLSVCIPAYNYKVEDLLKKLHFLLKRSEINYEIIVAEDASNEFHIENNSAANKYLARYIFLKKNLGRAAIRNFLCKEASFENLLFLDCDSAIIDDNFISRYLDYLNKGIVIYGGTAYQERKPERDFRLHWNYGRKRETQPLTIRNKFPTNYFKTNNFLIPRSILLAYPFNELLKGYGHEDTLMGFALSQNNKTVFHIDNPVLHDGLERNMNFIRKTEESIKNLLIIRKKFSEYSLNEYFKLLNVFSKVEKWNLIGLLGFLFLLLKPLLIFLITRYYWIRALDFYKLGFLCYLNKKAPLL